jgi:hypothetical protein
MKKMINHIRTLLLNLPPSPTQGEGEEYILESYEPPVLTSELIELHRVFFGENLPRPTMNYRAKQLMMLIHGTELAPLALTQDTRITYWPFQGGQVWQAEPKALIPVTALLDKLSPIISDNKYEIFHNPPSDVYEVLHDYWYNHKVFTRRIGAIALALAYRIGELRNEMVER